VEQEKNSIQNEKSDVEQDKATLRQVIPIVLPIDENIHEC
jgi:hypothetical protein